jgi:hypothetical protein
MWANEPFCESPSVAMTEHHLKAPTNRETEIFYRLA